MKKKTLGVRIGIALGLAVSLAANVYLFVLLVDAGIVVDNANSQADALWERRNVALRIIRLDWIGRPARELEALASELEADGVIIDSEGNAREIGDFVFEVEDGIVTAVYDFSGKSLE